MIFTLQELIRNDSDIFNDIKIFANNADMNNSP